MTARGKRGSALIESLAALTLVAAAGAVVAAAATTSLRAIRRAGDCERMTAIAARELALLQARGAPEETSERRLADPGFASPALLSTVVRRRSDGIAELTVTVDVARDAGGLPASPVTLATRMAVPE
jgi:type II secretory pathway pseudopilin PulG